MKHFLSLTFSLLFLALAMQVHAEEPSPTTNKKAETMTKDEAQKFFASMVGTWEGTAKTWFEPGKLADESKIRGTFKRIHNDDLLRHEYTSEIQGKVRRGDETFAFNPVQKHFEVTWIDSFHMSYAIMFSTGKGSEKGFTVQGKYDVAPDTPAWGWKTVYQMIDKDHLTITAYNIHPEGQEAKAVEVEYSRVEQND